METLSGDGDIVEVAVSLSAPYLEVESETETIEKDRSTNRSRERSNRVDRDREKWSRLCLVRVTNVSRKVKLPDFSLSLSVSTPPLSISSLKERLLSISPVSLSPPLSFPLPTGGAGQEARLKGVEDLSPGTAVLRRIPVSLSPSVSVSPSLSLSVSIVFSDLSLRSMSNVSALLRFKTQRDTSLSLSPLLSLCPLSRGRFNSLRRLKEREIGQRRDRDADKNRNKDRDREEEMSFSLSLSLFSSLSFSVSVSVLALCTIQSLKDLGRISGEREGVWESLGVSEVFVSQTERETERDAQRETQIQRERALWTFETLYRERVSVMLLRETEAERGKGERAWVEVRAEKKEWIEMLRSHHTGENYAAASIVLYCIV